MNEQSNMNQNQLEQERDYWKQRCHDQKEDMKTYIGLVALVICIICVELIINRFYHGAMH
jgi:hypothetical protein